MRNPRSVALALIAMTSVAVTGAQPIPPAAAAQQICGEWNQVDPPAGATGAILEVTALSPNEVWALGGALGTIRWDGSSWGQVALPDLSSLGTAFSLDALGAAGSTVFLSGVLQTSVWTNEQLLLVWDGAQWDRVESMELAQNAFGQPRYGAPRAVDGVAADDAWIVGTATSMGSGVVLTVHWDGSQLVEYITPGLGTRQNHLYDVSAVASDDAWAVGEFTSWSPEGNGALHGMTYHWDGSSWSLVPNPTETIDSVDLHAVEAISSNDVWAAGGEGVGPLFMHWDGTAWTIFPSPATTGTIQNLAAIASDDIWAVDSPAQVPLVSKYYHWDGVSWSIVNPPDILGATSVSRHGGLAAAGPCDVWACGSIDLGSGITPFLERLQSGSSATGAPLVTTGGALIEVAPNPFRHALQIRLQSPDGALNRASIFDVRGKLVTTLLGGPTGNGHLSWDGRDGLGRQVPGGVYFLRVDTGDDRVLTRKVTVVR